METWFVLKLEGHRGFVGETEWNVSDLEGRKAW